MRPLRPPAGHAFGVDEIEGPRRSAHPETLIRAWVTSDKHRWVTSDERLSLRELSRQADRGANTLRRPEHLDSRLLARLEAPEVAHVLALQPQGGSPRRRQPELAALAASARWVPRVASGGLQRWGETPECARDRRKRPPDRQDVSAD